jgi:HSP20 family protein
MAIPFFGKSKNNFQAKPQAAEPEIEDYEAKENSETEQNSTEIKRAKKLRKIKVSQEPKEVRKTEIEKTIENEGKEEGFTQKPILTEAPIEEKENWFKSAGQLAIDVYETDGEIVVQAPIAGVKAEDLDITIENDMLTIKGRREKPSEPAENRNYFCEECYWGPFIRKFILSEEVDASRAKANLKEGILTLRVPKIERSEKRKIMVKE